MPDKTKKTTMSMALSTFLVMVGLVFSKCSGALRDIFVVHFFTDPVYRDSFNLAFTIPDLFYNLLIGGSIQAAITPSLSAAIAQDKEKEGFRAVNIFISVFSVLMLVVCVLGTIFSEQLYSVYSIFKNSSVETSNLAAVASKMLFPQIFFMMLAALCIGILNAYKRFASTSFGPTIYNVCVLASILIFAGNSKKQLVMTTGGVMVAAIVYFVFQYVVGRDKLSQFRFIFRPKDSDFIVLVKKAVPILISASVVQINMVVLNVFANSFGESGQISALRYASTIWQIPYGIFAVAIGNVMMPTLAGLYSSGKIREASDLLSSRLRAALFLTIPSAGILMILNTDVVKAILQWGSGFTDNDAKMAGTYLIGYSLAVITHSVVFIYNQAFYAIGETKIPLYMSLISLISNPTLCALFISFGWGPISLTIAYTLTSVIRLILLVIFYNRRKELVPTRMLGFICKSVLCALIMCAVVFVFDKLLPGEGSKITQLLIISAKGITAVLVYFGLAILFKMQEATFWIDRFTAKLHKK